MDCQKIGNLIYELRKEKNMTQKQIANLMNISDKTISKWERGLGCPDTSLLLELANILGVSVEKLLSGEINLNNLVGGNMNKLKFYVCQKCNNLMTATGESEIYCCGQKLDSLEAKKAEDNHMLDIEPVEDELYITSKHDMKKDHYISFIAYLKGDSVLIAKQYPEWNLQFRLRKRGHGRLYYYCTNHGLFYQMI